MFHAPFEAKMAQETHEYCVVGLGSDGLELFALRIGLFQLNRRG
jgi:hypothetical protein